MKKIKEFIKKSKFIVKIYEVVVGTLKIKLRRFTVKTRFSYGNKNKDKTFFVIPVLPRCGLYSSILLSLLPVRYALQRGYRPVFDYKNTFNPLVQDEDKKGLENAWEYYYEQPCGVSLDEVYQSKRVIKYHRWVHKTPLYNWHDMFPTSDEELQYWHRFIIENFRLQRTLQKQIEKDVERLFPPNGKILGVGVRAGFRAMELAKDSIINGHPKTPSCEGMIQIVEQKMQEYGCEYIFLSCDDREYRQKFEHYYGEKCIAIDRHLRHYFCNDCPVENVEDVLIEIKNCSIREVQEEYIKETYLLSQCTSLYSCNGGGAVFSYFLNGGKYEYVDVYNEGYIHLKDKEKNI